MDILKIILQWGIPVICTGILTFISQKLKENDKSNKAIKAAMISLIRSQITSKVEKYTEMEYLPDYARYCLTDLLQQYKLLGGNHGIEILVDNCLKLPPIKLKKEGVENEIL